MSLAKPPLMWYSLPVSYKQEGGHAVALKPDFLLGSLQWRDQRLT